MSYALFLTLFLMVPLAGTLWIQRGELRAGGFGSLGVLLLLVYAGTIPWDGAAVAQGLWSFDPEKCWPARVDGLPVEELCFFGLQTLLTGLWVRHRLVRSFGVRSAA